MGLDRTIHLKPFIKIPVQYEENEREIKNEKVSTKSMLWSEELIGSENFYHYVEDETMYLFSNTRSETDINTDENVFTTLTPELIDDMIAEFTEKHKEDIVLLEAKLNSKVKVEFGFVYAVS